MKAMIKKLTALMIVIVMTVSVFATSVVAAEEKNVYSNDLYTVEKLSNPTTGEREVDGLEEGGDRKNSYAWSMERLTDEYGDYVYIGSNCNILYAVVGGSLSTGIGIDSDIVDALVNAVTNGEVDPSIKGLDLAQTMIARYNLKTGEMETWFDSAKYGMNPTSPYALISGFRAAKKFKDNIYFNANSSAAGSYLYRISSNEQTEPEVVFSSNGNGFMRSMTVSEDGNTMYVGGTLNIMDSMIDNENDYEIIVYKTTTGNLGEFEPIADVDDFARYKKAEYRSSGGDVWDMVEYNGEIYFTLMTTKGGMVFKGHEDKSDPNANQYGWVWEEFAGEEEYSPYGAGFGNAMNYALTPYVFNGDLYFIGFSNAMDAMMYGVVGLLQFLNGASDINAFFDSLTYMDAVMENETAVFRFTKNGEMEMVVGDESDCPDNINYVAKMHAGFNDASRSTTNYNWRAAIYNGKFYIGTFDSYPMFKYLTKLTNGDLLNMSSDEFREQLEYLKTFIELITKDSEETPPAEVNSELPEQVFGGQTSTEQMAFASVPVVSNEDDPTMEAIENVAAIYNQPIDAKDEVAQAGSGSNGNIEKLDDLAIKILFEILVRIQQNMDKEATTEFLSEMLLSIPEAGEKLDNLFDYLTFLQKLAGKKYTKYFAVVKGIVADISRALNSINPEGIERYVRISNTIAANENPGFELYGTADGINYDTVTLNGFYDEYNYGCRTLLTVDDGLLVGTANPFFGAQLWKVKENASTVTFDMNGHGTQIEPQTVATGSKATKPEDPTEDGWTFEGWYADATLNEGFDFDAAINVNTTVYAKWTENTSTQPPASTSFTVTFNMNGHGTQITAQTVESGSKAIKPKDPTAKGYTFGGWYVDEKFSTKFDFNKAIIADTTLYAKWTLDFILPTDPNSPQTGDNNNMLQWIALLFICGGVFVGTAAYNKKIKRESVTEDDSH